MSRLSRMCVVPREGWEKYVQRYVILPMCDRGRHPDTVTMPIDPGLSRWQTDDRRSGSSTPNDPDRVRPATPGRDERRCSLDGNIGSRSLVEEVTRRDDRHTQIDRRAAWGHSSRICRRRSHPATGDSTRHDGADLTKTRRARLSITRHRLHRISAHEMPPSATRPLFEKWFPAPLPFPP